MISKNCIPNAFAFILQKIEVVLFLSRLFWDKQINLGLNQEFPRYPGSDHIPITNEAGDRLVWAGRGSCLAVPRTAKWSSHYPNPGIFVSAEQQDQEARVICSFWQEVKPWNSSKFHALNFKHQSNPGQTVLLHNHSSPPEMNSCENQIILLLKLIVINFCCKFLQIPAVASSPLLSSTCQCKDVRVEIYISLHQKNVI